MGDSSSGRFRSSKATLIGSGASLGTQPLVQMEYRTYSLLVAATRPSVFGSRVLLRLLGNARFAFFFFFFCFEKINEIKQKKWNAIQVSALHAAYFFRVLNNEEIREFSDTVEFVLDFIVLNHFLGAKCYEDLNSMLYSVLIRVEVSTVVRIVNHILSLVFNLMQ